MGLFELLFDEWEQAEEAADACWASVRRAHEQRCQGIGPGPAPDDIENALRLRRIACEWHVALQAQLRKEREQVVVL